MAFRFMTKLNTNSGNETKSDIFPWGIFKAHTISFLSKNVKVFQRLLKWKISQFYE